MRDYCQLLLSASNLYVEHNNLLLLSIEDVRIVIGDIIKNEFRVGYTDVERGG